MKLSDNMRKALIQQIAMEFHSGYLYRSMSHDMKTLGLPGYASWLNNQYEEEREHALKIVDYIEERDGVVDFLPIAGVKEHFDCPIKVAEESLKHEELVSASIRKLFHMAREEGDVETELFLHWYIKEQVEEEANANDNVSAWKQVKDCSAAVYLLDQSLGKRE